MDTNNMKGALRLSAYVIMRIIFFIKNLTFYLTKSQICK